MSDCTKQVCATEARRRAHAFHVRELYRVMGLAREALEQGDVETARTILEMTEPQPAAEPHQLNHEEFAQAFEG